VQEVAETHAGKHIRVAWMDEARKGQKGTLTSIWTKRGTRPRVVRQSKYKWTYMYGCVEPASGANFGMIASCVDTEMMGLFLWWLSKTISDNEHMVLILDRAGWHMSKKLSVPDNITLHFLPPYSPELNPTELVWLWLREHQLSNRTFADQAALDAACVAAWNTLTPERIKTLCKVSWMPGN
jgi:DDE superfamily endonuclease